MRCLNFAAGPSTLPLEVLEQIRDELMDFRGEGASVMEISHRSAAFLRIHNETQELLRQLLGIPQDYEVLFMQGGGHLQFSMVPLNLLQPGGSADYIVNGTWSKKAAKEAARCGCVRMLEGTFGTAVPAQESLELDPGASYVYYCDNETVHGIEFGYVPRCGDVPVVSDMSSNILSRPVDVSKFGAIWFGAQKNFGIAGVAVGIVRKDLLRAPSPVCPTMLSWKTYADSNSMLNTPPTFAIYVMNLMAHWVLRQGGVPEMERRARERSGLLYDAIDGSGGFYAGMAEPASRSRMNVTFRLRAPELDDLFLKEAAGENIRSIKGHRSIGGMRASVYNAMPVEGARILADFMKEFARRHG